MLLLTFNRLEQCISIRTVNSNSCEYELDYKMYEPSIAFERLAFPRHGSTLFVPIKSH
jgi:hypothetical protein